MDLVAAQGVALRIVLEGARVVLQLLEGRAEGEMQVKAVIGAQVVARQLLAHGRDFSFAELVDLEVREAPPGFSALRQQCDAAVVCLDAVGLAARGRERVAVAHPDAGLTGTGLQHCGKKLECLRKIAYLAEHDGLEVAVSAVIRVRRHQAVDLFERLRWLVEPVQHDGIVVACLDEAGGQLQAAQQEPFRIPVQAEARAGLRQHAQRRHVGRMPVKIGAQQLLSFGDAIFDQRRCCFEEFRVARRSTDVIRVSGIRAGRVPGDNQGVAQSAPSVRQIRPESERTPDRSARLRVLARLRQRLSVFEVRYGRARLRAGQGAQRLQRGRQVAEAPLGDPGHQHGLGVTGHDLEDFFRLLQRQGGVAAQQSLRVRQGDFEGAGRFRGAIHASASQKRRIRRAASFSTVSSVAKQARTKPCAPAPNAAPSRSETPSAR